MPVSSEIYGNVGRGVQQLEDPQSALLRALQVQQARMQGQQAQRGVEDDQALRQATMESGGDQNKLMQLLYGRGNYGAASKVQESIQKAAKAKGDLAHVGAQTEREGATARETKRKTEDASLARYRAQLDYVDNPQTAARWTQAQYADPDVGPILSQFGPLEQAIAEIPQDPQAFAQWREQQSQGMEKFRAGREQKPAAVDAGGQKLFLDMNPRSPTYKGQLSSTAVTQSEPQRLQLEQQARENAANRGKDMKIAGMVDARQRDATSSSRDLARERLEFDKTKPSGTAAAKPMPASAARLQNDELTAIGVFGGLDSDIAGIEKQLTDGTINVGPVNNLVSRGRNFAGMSTEESRNFATLRSKMENMRNAVLLLNKGVQTEGDAQRAMSEIMDNLNDPGVLKQRLAEIRALNQRAVALRKNNVDMLRSNYGHEGMDFSKFESQPATTNLGASPANPNPKADRARADAILKGG